MKKKKAAESTKQSSHGVFCRAVPSHVTASTSRPTPPFGALAPSQQLPEEAGAEFSEVLPSPGQAGGEEHRPRTVPATALFALPGRWVTNPLQK